MPTQERKRSPPSNKYGLGYRYYIKNVTPENESLLIDLTILLKQQLGLKTRMYLENRPLVCYLVNKLKCFDDRFDHAPAEIITS